MPALYWGLEYAKILACYLFILFIWPSVVFRKYLHGKSKIFRFGFCAVVPVVLYTTAVLGLGLLHLLNVWVVNILFYGVFLFSIGKSFWPDAAQKKKLRRLVTGSLKLRTIIVELLSDFRFWLRQTRKKIWREARPHLLEFFLLAVLVTYGVIYFSYSPFVNHSYGFGDMYTHHSWIYGLIQGQIFSEGIYPEGMHCVIYLMHTVSGLSVYSCNLFLGCIQTAVLLLSAYCLMREIFRWHGTPLLVLAFFLVVAVNSTDAVISMARLQRTLPGEYGLYTVYLCALFLLRFLKGELQEGWQKDPRAWLKNENLVIFSLTLAASVAIHFYATIMAFFICLPFALVYIRRVFSRTRFLPLAAAVLCGVMIAVLPMAGARLSGIPFQASVDWALKVANGDITESLVWQSDSSETEAPETEAPETLPSVWNTARNWVSGLFRHGYFNLLGIMAGVWMVCCSVLMAAFFLYYRLYYVKPHPHVQADMFDSHLAVVIASFIFVMMFTAPYTGLPELISYNRVPSTTYLLLLMVAAIPVDVLFRALQQSSPNWLLQTAPVVCVAALFAVTLATGNYHGYFYNELTRYRSAVDVTSSIIQSFPRNTYTVVCSTDDMYQIIQHGRHEELIGFLKAAEQEQGYYLPTEYVFIYVEKRPIDHAQNHYSSGSVWLATDTYADRFSALGKPRTSKYPEVYASRITGEDAQRSITEYSNRYDSYRDLDNRTVINSKAYQWCQDFAALYDREMKIYYEDEDFVCYYFRQNTYSLYDLAIWSQTESS